MVQDQAVLKLFQKAKDHESLNQFKRAIAIYKLILETKPNHYFTLLSLGFNYSRLGDLENATRYYQLAEKVQQEFQAEKEGINITMSAAEEQKLASMDLDQKISEFSAEVEKETISSKAEDVDLDDMIESVKGKTSSVTPVVIRPPTEPAPSTTPARSTQVDNLSIYRDLGTKFLKERKFDDAIPIYRKILHVNPQDNNAWSQLALIFYEKEDYEKSVVYFQKVLEIDPENSNALSYLGWGYYHLKRYEKTIECSKLSLKMEPNKYSAWSYLAWSYKQLEQYPYALFCFQKALSLSQDTRIEQEISTLQGQGIEPFNPMDEKLKICTECGERIRQIAKFCDQCGVSQLKKTPDMIKTCIICRDNILTEMPATCRNCNSCFHRTCLLKWIENFQVCPHCNENPGWI